MPALPTLNRRAVGGIRALGSDTGGGDDTGGSTWPPDSNRLAGKLVPYLVRRGSTHKSHVNRGTHIRAHTHTHTHTHARARAPHTVLQHERSAVLETTAAVAP